MKDKIFKVLLILLSIGLLILTAGFLLSLIKGALPAFFKFGFLKFIFSSKWNPVGANEQYGALPFIVGTLFTSFLALIVCIPFALSVSLFNGEFYRGTKRSKVLKSMVDLLAGIPSIIFGLWGFYALRPLFIELGVNKQGFGILAASIILAIMIIPYASSLSTEFISLIPKELKEAAYSMGATRLEVIRYVIIPTSSSGVFAAFILALGRALGETMAVTMLIGNTNNVPLSIRDTGNTMASIIANQFGEASGIKFNSLIAIGLLLFLITAVINIIARLIIKRLAAK